MKVNRKFILLLLLIIIIVGLLTYILVAKRFQPKEITISTEQGNVRIPDITKNPIENLSAGGVTFQLSDDFSIEYYPEDKGFVITLLNRDIEAAQMKAEQEFLRALEISKENACKLNVSIGVPYSVDENLAGGIYKMSFCPGGKLLKN